MIQDYIKFFLTYGYFPRKSIQTIQFNDYNYDYENYSIDTLGEKASELFHASVDSLYNNNEKHLIPLSGGFDSRAILATLLKFTEAKNLYAYSFGAKGTLDYEIGKKLAKKLGVNHIAFDLQAYEYSLDDLLYQSSSINKQTFLFHNAPLKNIDELFNGFKIWSGIVGDVVAGSAIPVVQSKSSDEAIEKYLKSKKYAKDEILESNIDFKKFILFNSFDEESKLSLDEKLILTERYENSYKPHICAGEHTYLQPFINNEFTDFMFNSPRKLRTDFSIYYAMLDKIDSKLYRYPSKKRMGLSINSSDFKYNLQRVKYKIKREFGNNRISVNTNYFDFNIKMLTCKKFNQLIKEQISDLNDRNLIDFLDLKYIFKKYDSGQVSQNLIKTLVAFEVHLKNNKIMPSTFGEIC